MVKNSAESQRTTKRPKSKRQKAAYPHPVALYGKPTSKLQSICVVVNLFVFIHLFGLSWKQNTLLLVLLS